MKYGDRLLTLIASKTDLDPQALKSEVITRFFEPTRDEGAAFIDDLLKWRGNHAVLSAIIMDRLDTAVESVVNDEESLAIDETQAQRRADFDRTEARGLK